MHQQHQNIKQQLRQQHQLVLEHQQMLMQGHLMQQQQFQHSEQQARLSHHQLPQTAFLGGHHQMPYQQNQQMWPPQAFPNAAQQPPAVTVAFQDLFSGRGKDGGAAEEDDEFTDFTAAPPAASVASKAAKTIPRGVDRIAPLDMGLFGAHDELQQQVWHQLHMRLPDAAIAEAPPSASRSGAPVYCPCCSS
jgi:hypothetical protein